MSYNPEYYGAPEIQGTERALFDGEINVVENIKNYNYNKAAVITQDDDEVQMHELKQKISQLETELASKS